MVRAPLPTRERADMIDCGNQPLVEHRYELGLMGTCPGFGARLAAADSVSIVLALSAATIY
jgi:hypothetical protein